MRRWVEAFPHAISGSMKLLEPSKYRNLFFESAKALVPLGAIKFAPCCPKHDIIVLDDGTERKLGRSEQNSLIQMDLMKEEIASMVRIKSPGTGRTTYQLPAEKRNKMHDDRAYVFVMSCWYIKQLRDKEVLGDETSINFSPMFTTNASSNRKSINIENKWGSLINRESSSKGYHSPFAGDNPFKKQ